MKFQFLILLVVSFFLLGCDEHSTEKYFYQSKDYPNFSIVELEWSGVALSEEMAKHAEIAKQRQQKVFLQMTGEWCSPCKRLRGKTEVQPLKEAYAGTYIIRLDYDEWKIDMAQLGLQKAPVPSFWELGQNNQVTSYYINGNGWPEITAESMAPILATYFSGAAREYVDSADKFLIKTNTSNQ